jgi:uncharacterized protein
MTTASRVFHVMAKPAGAICNLDCAYCFNLAKEELYPDSGFRMPADVHEAYIRQLLEAQTGVDEVVFAFQGGEPTLMGVEFFRHVDQSMRVMAGPLRRGADATGLRDWYAHHLPETEDP